MFQQIEFKKIFIATPLRKNMFGNAIYITNLLRFMVHRKLHEFHVMITMNDICMYSIS
jgi:hypothetical protein